MAANEIPTRRDCRPFTTASGLQRVPWSTLRGPGYRQLVHGVRDRADSPPDHERLIRAVRAKYGDRVVLLGPSAAWAHGCRLADPGCAVHVATPLDSGIRRQASIVPHPQVLTGADVVQTRLGPATSLDRTAIDCARGVGTSELSPDSRVEWVDSLLHNSGLTAARARAYCMSVTGLRGLPMGRRVIHLARDGAESVRETRLRLLVVRAGIQEPALQHVVLWPSGAFVARLDMAWVELRLGLEYDGAHHRDYLQYSKDLDRQNALRALDWHVVQVDARALARPDVLIPRLRAMIASSRAK